MIRSLLSVAAVGSLVTMFVNAGGCSQAGVGDPCVPEQEYDPTFSGFDQGQVNVESKSFQCQTRLCLVNHFRGRVTCPYGQKADGTKIEGAAAGCTIPGSDKPVEGANGSKTVDPNCEDRQPDRAVYCSCRCQNIDGRTDDGANYCTCPEGFECKQLVTSIGAGDTGLTGGYCIKSGTAYDSVKSCNVACDPASKKCGKLQL